MKIELRIPYDIVSQLTVLQSSIVREISPCTTGGFSWWLKLRQSTALWMMTLLSLVLLADEKWVLNFS